MSFSIEELKAMMRNTVKDVLAEHDGIKRLAENQESHVDHVVGCPRCYPEVIKKARETFKYQCSDCGLPLPDGMVGPDVKDIPCPNCGSTQAGEIRR